MESLFNNNGISCYQIVLKRDDLQYKDKQIAELADENG